MQGIRPKFSLMLISLVLIIINDHHFDFNISTAHHSFADLLIHYMGRRKKQRIANLRLKKKATIVYDSTYGWWMGKFSREYGNILQEKFESIVWQTYSGKLPHNFDNSNLLVIVPRDSDGIDCVFEQYDIRTIQDIVLDAVAKEWRRIHLHSSFTSRCFNHLSLESAENRIVISGFKNEISAEKEQAKSSADTYLAEGCTESSLKKSIQSLVELCIFEKGHRKIQAIKRRCL